MALIPADLTRQMARLGTRLRLRGAIPVQTHVSGDVIPTTDLDVLLRTPGSAEATVDLSGTAGVYTAIHTVPSGKRWSISWIRRQNTTANSWMLVKYASAAAATFLTVTATAESAFAIQIVLNEGDSIGMASTGNGGDTARGITVYREEEDAF